MITPSLCDRWFWIVLDFLQIFKNNTFRQVIVGQLTAEIFFVSGKIHQTMTTEIEQYHFFFTFLFCFFCFNDYLSNGMACFRSRNDAFGFGKENTCLITFELMKRLRIDETQDSRLAYQSGHTMITQTAGMNGRWYKRMPQGMHGYQWG